MKKTNHRSVILRWTVDVCTVLFGTFLFALSVQVFMAPNHIAPGGVTGIATVINYLTGVPIGLITLLINIPIAVLGFVKLGKNFMIKTILSLLSFTLFVDYLLKGIPVYTGNVLLAALFGGVLTGSGIGLLLSRGASSGGMDIVNKVIQQRVPHLQIGQVVLLSDFVVIGIAMLAYKTLESGLYALVAVYLMSVALDKVLYGFNTCKFMYIVSDHEEELARRINQEMHRGATILESYGSYTGKKRPTIMVAVRQHEYYRINRIIKTTDPAAFVIVTSATEIMGKGFTEPET